MLDPPAPGEVEFFVHRRVADVAEGRREISEEGKEGRGGADVEVVEEEGEGHEGGGEESGRDEDGGL